MGMIAIARRFVLALAAGLALAANTAAHAAEISGDLIAKAKQEGQVVYYTDLIVDQIVRPLASAFEAKYGIKVSYTRADSQVNILKILNEQKAGREFATLEVLNAHTLRVWVHHTLEQLVIPAGEPVDRSSRRNDEPPGDRATERAVARDRPALPAPGRMPPARRGSCPAAAEGPPGQSGAVWPVPRLSSTSSLCAFA